MEYICLCFTGVVCWVWVFFLLFLCDYHSYVVTVCSTHVLSCTVLEAGNPIASVLFILGLHVCTVQVQCVGSGGIFFSFATANLASVNIMYISIE